MATIEAVTLGRDAHTRLPTCSEVPQPGEFAGLPAWVCRDGVSEPATVRPWRLLSRKAL